MTRQEIIDAYDVKDGLIRSPGKFEGEPIYAPYFYDGSGDGEELSRMEDGLGDYVALLVVDDTDRAIFPELDQSLPIVIVTEDDQGFVRCSQLSEDSAQHLREEYAKLIEDAQGDEDETA